MTFSTLLIAMPMNLLTNDLPRNILSLTANTKGMPIQTGKCPRPCCSCCTWPNHSRWSIQACTLFVKAKKTQEKERIQTSTSRRVAYGDAGIRGTYRGNTPVPVKQVQRAIAQKATVFTVDEFRTSVTCCHCQRRMNNVTSELNTCNHNKKKA